MHLSLHIELCIFYFYGASPRFVRLAGWLLLFRLVRMRRRDCWSAIADRLLLTGRWNFVFERSIGNTRGNIIRDALGNCKREAVIIRLQLAFCANSLVLIACCSTVDCVRLKVVARSRVGFAFFEDSSVHLSCHMRLDQQHFFSALFVLTIFLVSLGHN